MSSSVRRSLSNCFRPRRPPSTSSKSSKEFLRAIASIAQSKEFSALCQKIIHLIPKIQLQRCLAEVLNGILFIFIHFFLELNGILSDDADLVEALKLYEDSEDIYQLMERSGNFPVCGKVMLFDETT
ncbi:unnamed protein product [Vicia faba]|uniref:Uncharacterized protein n=1 Tax=Vicia faba TaxID=3906 RepID=A0AAV0YAI3_VICFA|nr:unnamed protein product [Vicia faba]